MISYNEALNAILANVEIMPAENIRIEDSVSRILAEDIYSGIEMPPFDKSAVDGYALNSRDVKEASIELRCIGLIQAGQDFKKPLKKGECVKIMTGAMLPKNADCVIMVEDTQANGAFVRLLKAVKKRENVCIKGEDLKRGRKVLTKGEKILISHLPLLATVGRSYVKVVAAPKAAVLNTGGEIIPVGRRLPENKIYNSNGPLLCSVLAQDGITPIDLGIAKDNVQDLKQAIKIGLKQDILLVSGGVSMGDYDLVPQVLISLGAKKIFHKVNIKPGKPLFFAVKDKTLIFGIPGNPVSNFLTYLIFIRPALYKMMGYTGYRPMFREGFAKKPFHSKPGRKHFVPVKVFRKNVRYNLKVVVCHGSADILALSRADGFMVINEDTGSIKQNAKTQFITWKIRQ